LTLRVTKAEPESATDRELVAQCQAGDEQAFEELVRRHQHRAVNVAYQLLRDESDAVEVAQDAFVNIYRHIGTFRFEAEFTTWLHQIVVNLAHNKHRWWKRRGRERTFSLDQNFETSTGAVERQMATTDPGPEAETLETELVERLDRAMQRLPRKFREVLVLRNVEQLSYAEIAAVLRCSVGTVKSRMTRARDALRARLKAEQ